MKMILANTEDIEGEDIAKTLGLVRGSMVKSKHLGHDIFAGFKTLVGGEIKGYTKMMDEARDEATNRMIKEAEALGADAIVNVRFTSSEIMAGTSEILAYGTAVKLE